MTKICFVGPCNVTIPPQGWGAVESIIWDYKINLEKRDYNILILTDKTLNEMVEKIIKFEPNYIHIMYDDNIDIIPLLKNRNIIPKSKIIYTTHFAYITHPDFKNKFKQYYNDIFIKSIDYKDDIDYLNVISEQIRDIYIAAGFSNNKIHVINNGAREDAFEYKLIPKYSNKSVYIAKIEERKCQYKYQSIESIDFVGNYANSTFDITNKNYLGEWSKEQLYSNLTDYENLILLSNGEADPLVVKEALIAGLGVVVSECAIANLDITKEYIDVIPNEKLDDIEYIENIINQNREISINMRDKIREYGLIFSWNNIINKYTELI
jgi:glycosyltransferase involved in cell wall biosynthesis